MAHAHGSDCIAATCFVLVLDSTCVMVFVSEAEEIKTCEKPAALLSRSNRCVETGEKSEAARAKRSYGAAYLTRPREAKFSKKFVDRWSSAVF